MSKEKEPAKQRGARLFPHLMFDGDKIVEREGEVPAPESVIVREASPAMPQTVEQGLRVGEVAVPVALLQKYAEQPPVGQPVDF